MDISENINELLKLSQYNKFVKHAEASWSEFQARRNDRLVQAGRNDGASEKVAENILGDLFTVALDWNLSDVNYQLHYADMVLTRSGINRIVIEAKRPGSLDMGRTSLDKAIEQARRYADEQRIKTIAVSDGIIFYAADIVNGGLSPRAQFKLDAPAFCLNSWWVSREGIDRDSKNLVSETSSQMIGITNKEYPYTEDEVSENILLHAKYNIPAICFAYAPDATNPNTWKLPCWEVYGERVDKRRLSGAIRSVISNYRGAHASIPEEAVPDVLVRLGKAASMVRKLPGQDPNPKKSFQQLYDALYQVDRLDEVIKNNIEAGK